MIRAGKLSHRVQIQEDVRGTPKDSGQETESWQTVFECWAGMEPVGGGEKWRGFQVQDDEDYAITIRYRDGVTSKHQVKKGERTFAITRVVNEDEADVVLHLFATERV